MDDSEDYDNTIEFIGTIEFITVKEENIEEITKEHHQEKKRENVEDDEVNAVYIKSEEVYVNHENTVSEFKSLEKVERNGLDVLMCEDEDPLLPLPFVAKDLGNNCSPNDEVLQETVKEVRHKKVNAKKLFSCEVCEKKFTLQSNLIIHKRVHTKEKPYVCEVCRKAFSEKGNLLKHIENTYKRKSHINYSVTLYKDNCISTDINMVLKEYTTLLELQYIKISHFEDLTGMYTISVRETQSMCSDFERFKGSGCYLVSSLIPNYSDLNWFKFLTSLKYSIQFRVEPQSPDPCDVSDTFADAGRCTAFLYAFEIPGPLFAIILSLESLDFRRLRY
ncbi:zinc finger protein 354A-like [Penaeus monodon]|uniref:zinc finger protein 354A-like n=1 Tax=Penaeus monodon TaxID=6687 RepID=UPI0018A6F8CF|nr:zinc finger protein 354A-like [Penaeus monodon]